MGRLSASVTPKLNVVPDASGVTTGESTVLVVNIGLKINWACKSKGMFRAAAPFADSTARQTISTVLISLVFTALVAPGVWPGIAPAPPGGGGGGAPPSSIIIGRRMTSGLIIIGGCGPIPPSIFAEAPNPGLLVNCSIHTPVSVPSFWRE